LRETESKHTHTHSLNTCPLLCTWNPGCGFKHQNKDGERKRERGMDGWGDGGRVMRDRGGRVSCLSGPRAFRAAKRTGGYNLS